VRTSSSAFRVLGFLVFFLVHADALRAYNLSRNGSGQTVTWDAGTVPMRIQMGAGSVLSDGTTFNSSTQTALQTWNSFVNSVQFAPEIVTAAAPADDAVNQMGFGNSIYGTAFDSNVLAVTISYYSTTPRSDGTSRRIQSDVIFNSGYTWDSYRGPERAAIDVRRVALHELGHVLGLGHPDQANPPQNVIALMNAYASDLDALAGDDITGAQYLYGATATSTAPTFYYISFAQNSTAGEAASFQAYAIGFPTPSLRWQRLASGSGSWQNLNETATYTGTTTANLTVFATTTTMSGDQLRCVATNTAGTATSTSIALTVAAPNPPTITSHPYSQSVTQGDNLGLYVYVNGTAPFTYRWQHLPSGGGAWEDLTETSIYAGVVNSYLAITGVTLVMNGDQFRCVVTNAGGVATSLAAVITVIPATPPTVYNQPYNATTVAGVAIGFSMYGQGSNPMSYRWQRQSSGGSTWSDLSDGVVYTGTSTPNLWINSPTLAMSGDGFRCRISNVAGAVTTTAATLTVTPVIAPAISGLPGSLSVNYGDAFVLSPVVTGTYPYTVKWYKNGTEIAGSNSAYFVKYGATAADSGSYSMTASNSAGTATSSTVVVTVSAVIPPSITQQPLAQEVVKGYDVGFSVSATGSSPLYFQWYKNGQAIPSATSSYYSMYAVTVGNAGSYSVRVTNDGGVATSNSVDLVVLPAVLPQFTYWTSQVSISTNSYFYIYGGITGTLPMTYQWYKDGVAISGATYSNYSGYATSPNDAGVYHLQVTNEAGLAVSPETSVTWTNSASAAPWVDAVRLNDIVYFLAVSPGRIMRFDLSQESWLPIVYLSETKVPTAFLPTAEGVFIAYGRELVRRSLNLQTEAPVTTSAATIQTLFSAGSWLYYQEGTNIKCWNRGTLAAGPSSATGYYEGGFNRPARPVYSGVYQRLYTTRPGTSPNDIESYSVDGSGSITRFNDSPYHGDFRIGSRQYLSPNSSLLFDNSGVIYTVDSLTYAASIGRAFDDLAFLADGTPLVLRGQFLTAHAGSGYAETGSAHLPFSGVALFSRGDSAYVFGSPASISSNPGLSKITSGSLTSTHPIATSPVNRIMTVDDAFVSAGGIVHLVSRSEKGIVRWDTTTASFLPTLPLRGRPIFSSYAPAVGRVAFVYGDGATTDVFPASNSGETLFGYVPVQNVAFSLVAMDELTFLNIRQSDTGASLRIVLGATGEPKYLSSWSYWGTAQSWQSSSRRLYSTASFITNGMEYSEVSYSGIVPASSSATASDIVPPLRFSQDGSLAMSANKRVLNADLQQVGLVENAVLDAVWLPNNFLTIRARPSGTEVQSWARITYAKGGTLQLPGSPIRILQLNDTTVEVLTLVNGYLAFSRVSADLSLLNYSVNASSVAGAPTIVTQPVSATLNPGANVVFTVAVSGDPSLNIQWQRNGANIVGATSTSYSINSASTSNAGDYRAVVTNSAGSAVSATASLTVLDSVYPKLFPLYRTVMLRNIRWDELANDTLTLMSGSKIGRIYQELIATQEFKNRRIDSVLRLYYAGLARPADYGGLIGWSTVLKNGQSTLAQVAEAFVGSSEFQSRYGNLTATQFVQQLYRNVLGREADPGGLAFWVGQINGGASRGYVLAGFSESPEFIEIQRENVTVERAFAIIGGRMPGYAEALSWKEYLRGEDQTDAFLSAAEFAGLHPGGISDGAFVALAYQGFLLRAVDPIGQTFWVGELANGKISRTGLVDRLISSSEYRDVVATVCRFYMGCLGRLPDTAGLSGWSGFMRAGHSVAELANGFASAPEFQAQTAGLTNAAFVQQLYRGVLGREADPAGLTGWSTLLNTGQMTRTVLLTAFVQSQEAGDRFGPDIRSYLHYLSMLGRYPSSGELATWYLYLNGLQDEFIQDLVDAPGFTNK
jgi:hypothetical protein